MSLRATLPVILPALTLGLGLGLAVAGVACAPDQNRNTIPVCDAPQTNCRCLLQGWAVCGDVCVDPRADPQHCGGCGVACSDGQVCNAGVCADTCGSQEQCGATCRRPDDPFNCGTCGKECEGACVDSVCEEDIQCGSKARCSGRCVDTQTDDQNCGACGKKCTGDGFCRQGSCATCSSVFGYEWSRCGDYCAILSESNEHCGTCNHKCESGTSCKYGSCKSSSGY